MQGHAGPAGIREYIATALPNQCFDENLSTSNGLTVGLFFGCGGHGTAFFETVGSGSFQVVVTDREPGDIEPRIVTGAPNPGECSVTPTDKKLESVTIVTRSWFSATGGERPGREKSFDRRTPFLTLLRVAK